MRCAGGTRGKQGDMRIAGGGVALICAMAGCALETEPVGAADDELMRAASSERVEYDAPVLPEEPTGPVGVCDKHEDCQLFGLAWCLPTTYVGGGHFPDSGGYRVPKGCYGLFHGIGQMCDP